MIFMHSLMRNKAFFPDEDWFSLGIRKQYIECEDRIENIKKIVSDPETPLDKQKVTLLKTVLVRLKKLRNNLGNSLEEYGNSLPSEPYSLMEHAEKCEERLNKLSETKARIKQYQAAEVKYIEEAYSAEAYELFKKNLTEVIRFLENELKDLLTEWDATIKGFFKELISDYFEVDNDDTFVVVNFNSFDFTPFSDSEKKVLDNPIVYDFIQFSIHIKTSGGDYSIIEKERFDAPPRAYLNTFKFKLFCVAMKMACCCIAKKMYRSNYPLIIDDVFDASDFENRVMIRNFAAKLSRQHKHLLPEKDYSLQIIFFTQDDLVASQMEKGLKDGLGADNVILGRIFDYHEVDLTHDNVRIDTTDGNKRGYFSVVDTSPVPSKKLQKYDETVH